MTLYNFINTIEATALKSKYINAFGQGDVYENLNSGNKQYPYCNLTIDNITSNGDTSIVTCNLFYIDRLTVDSSNKKEVQSFALTALDLVFTKLQEDNTLTIDSKTYYPFVEQFSDLCAGAYATCNITIPEDIVCSDDNFESKTLSITQNGTYSTVGYDTAEVDVHPDDELSIFTLYPSNYFNTLIVPGANTTIEAKIQFTGDGDYIFAMDADGLTGIKYNEEENQTYAGFLNNSEDWVPLNLHKDFWQKGAYKVILSADKCQIGYYTFKLNENKVTGSFRNQIYIGYDGNETSSMEIYSVKISNQYGVVSEFVPKIVEGKAKIVDSISGNDAEIRTVYEQSSLVITNEGIVIVPTTDIDLGITPTNINWTYEAKAKFINVGDSYILRGQTTSTRCFLLFCQNNNYYALNCTTCSFGTGVQPYDVDAVYNIKLNGDKLTLNDTTTTINTGNELPISLHIGNKTYQYGTFILYSLVIRDDSGNLVFNGIVRKYKGTQNYQLYDTVSKRILYTYSGTVTTLEAQPNYINLSVTEEEYDAILPVLEEMRSNGKKTGFPAVVE